MQQKLDALREKLKGTIEKLNGEYQHGSRAKELLAEVGHIIYQCSPCMQFTIVKEYVPCVK